MYFKQIRSKGTTSIFYFSYRLKMPRDRLQKKLSICSIVMNIIFVMILVLHRSVPWKESGTSYRLSLNIMGFL